MGKGLAFHALVNSSIPEFPEWATVVFVSVPELFFFYICHYIYSGVVAMSDYTTHGASHVRFEFCAASD